MAKCKLCGAPIIWVRTEKKNGWMPCNDELTEYKALEDGEDSIIDDKGRVIRCTFDFQCEPDGKGRIPHWATCPHADEFRRKPLENAY